MEVIVDICNGHTAIKVLQQKTICVTSWTPRGGLHMFHQSFQPQQMRALSDLPPKYEQKNRNVHAAFPTALEM